jgi:hypothetical protein
MSMSEEILNQPCVRITIILDEKIKGRGSGTLVKGRNGFFVVTAHHCVYGDDNQFKDIGVDAILVETQATFNSSFQKIETVEIVDANLEEDWVLIKMNYQDTEKPFPIVLTSDNFKKDMPVVFTGFQAIDEDHGRSFKSRVLNGLSRNEFRITLSDQDSFKGGADDAKGLSGSGAFIVNEEKLYFIGILKSVKGDEAANNDIKCSGITKLCEKIGLDAYDISTDVFGDDWGSDQFGEIVLSDSRNLIEKIQAVNNTISELKIQRYCRELALGKSELSSILERDLSAIKYRIFEACQEELVDFVDKNPNKTLSTDEIKGLIEKFTEKGIEIIKVKSAKYKYPNLDDELIKRIVLDLINECYLSFDAEGVYAE